MDSLALLVTYLRLLNPSGQCTFYPVFTTKGIALDGCILTGNLKDKKEVFHLNDTLEGICSPPKPISDLQERSIVKKKTCKWQYYIMLV